MSLEDTLTGFTIWIVFGIFAFLQATRVSKIKNPITLILLSLSGPLGFLFCYFFTSPPSEDK